jgi:hypothetical protein
MKNVNLGVVFVTLTPTSYQWAVEDDQTGTGTNRTSQRQAVSAVLADPAQASPVQNLPVGLRFSTTCPAGVPTSGAWESGFRFNRLGAWCDPGSTTCPALGTGANLVFNITSGSGNTSFPDGSYVCVEDPARGLRRTVAVRSGGRVLAQP